VIEICKRSLHNFDAINVVAALHRLATGQIRFPEAVESADALSGLIDAATPRITELQPRGLANTAWSLAVLRLLDSPCLDAIAAESLTKLQSEQPHWRSQELANLAWAFAKLHIAYSPLLDSLAASSLRNCTLFTP